MLVLTDVCPMPAPQEQGDEESATFASLDNRSLGREIYYSLSLPESSRCTLLRDLPRSTE